MLRQTSPAPSGATVRRADCALTQSADAAAGAAQAQNTSCFGLSPTLVVIVRIRAQ